MGAVGEAGHEVPGPHFVPFGDVHLLDQAVGLGADVRIAHRQDGEGPRDPEPGVSEHADSARPGGQDEPREGALATPAALRFGRARGPIGGRRGGARLLVGGIILAVAVPIVIVRAPAEELAGPAADLGAEQAHERREGEGLTAGH